MKKLKIIIGKIIFLILLIQPVFGTDISFQMIVSPDMVVEGDLFTITIQINSEKEISIDEIPAITKIKGLILMASPRIEKVIYTYYIGYIIFKQIRYTIYYKLYAQNFGNYKLESLQCTINGSKYILRSYLLSVTPKNTKKVDINEPFFLMVELSNNNPFIGEKINCYWNIYSLEELYSISVAEKPLFNNFISEDFIVDKTNESIFIFNREYKKYTIFAQTLYPLKSGNLLLPSLNFSCSVYDAFSENYKKEPYSFPSKILPIQSINTDYKNFISLVGSYEISYYYTRVENESGTYYKLDLALKGNGNHKYANFNAIAIPQEAFIIIGPKVLSLESDIHISYQLLPKSNGILMLPQISFSYFNSDKKEFEIITIPQSQVVISKTITMADNPFTSNNNAYQFSSFPDNYYYPAIFKFKTVLLLLFLPLFIFILFLFYKSVNLLINKSKEKHLTFIVIWTKFIDALHHSHIMTTTIMDEKSFIGLSLYFSNSEITIIKNAQIAYNSRFKHNNDSEKSKKKNSKHIRRFIRWIKRKKPYFA